MPIHKRDGRFRARVTIDGSNVHIGTYDTVEDARAACDLEMERIRAGTSALTDKRLRTYTSFADDIGVPHGTVKRWVREGMPARRVGKSVRIDPHTANMWIAENRPESISVRRRSVVYAAQRQDGAIKLGWTSDAERRMRELRRDMCADVVLLVAVPGDKPDELRLHNHFAAKRIDGEWYAAEANDVVAAILRGAA